MGRSQYKFFLSKFTENVNNGVIGSGEFNGGIHFGIGAAPSVVRGAQLAFFEKSDGYSVSGVIVQGEFNSEGETPTLSAQRITSDDECCTRFGKAPANPRFPRSGKRCFGEFVFGQLDPRTKLGATPNIKQTSPLNYPPKITPEKPFP